MEAQLRLLAFDDLDQDAYCRLQQQAFAEIYAKNAIPIERLNREFLAWKYRPPAGPARIALILHGDEMVACNAMFPLDLVRGSERQSGWQSCDTATTPAARGKGYFKRCLVALQESLDPGERFFGYPNENSRKGFDGIGWSLTAEIPFRVRPVWWGARERDEIEFVAEFGAGQDEFARRLASQEPTMIERSAAYLNWRYVQHPFYVYERFHCVRDGVVTGLLVLNRAVVRRKQVMVVMEFLALDAPTARALASQAVRSARTTRCSMLIAIGNRAVPRFLPVPAAFAPKKQLLMGQVIGPPHIPMSEPWLVQAGDWDVF